MVPPGSPIDEDAVRSAIQKRALYLSDAMLLLKWYFVNDLDFFFINPVIPLISLCYNRFLYGLSCRNMASTMPQIVPNIKHLEGKPSQKSGPRVARSLVALEAGSLGFTADVSTVHEVCKATCNWGALSELLRFVYHCAFPPFTLVAPRYDRNGDFHYDLISALHKSLRGGLG